MQRFAGVLLALGLAIVPAGAAAHEGRIVGGQKADWHQFPYYASIDDGLCSGALIAPDRVLTAAHCLDNVAVGSTVAVNGGDEVRKVVHLAQNPKLTKLTKGAIEFPPTSYDSAVLALDQPVTDVIPLPLATPQDAATVYPPGTVVTTMGKGSSSFSGDGDGPFRTAQVQVRDDNDCAAMIKKEHSDLWAGAAMLCTTDPDATKPFASACYGDSGSPLVAAKPDGSLLEIGLDSWGVKCGEDNGGPEEYTDVGQISSFALDPAITWRPEYIGGMRLTGKPRVGRTLRCSTARYNSPQPGSIERGFAYSHDNGLYGYYYIKGKTLKLTSKYRGRNVACYAYALNKGGPVLDFSSRRVTVR